MSWPTREECLRLLDEAGVEEDVRAHIMAVERLATKLAEMAGADVELVTAAALLHDIGRAESHGIDHAVRGAEMARRLGLPVEIVNIIERHIGAGLTEEDAVELGLPRKSYLPETLEEKLLAHADNLFRGDVKEPVRMLAERWLAKGLDSSVERLYALHMELSELVGIDIDRIDA